MAVLSRAQNLCAFERTCEKIQSSKTYERNYNSERSKAKYMKIVRIKFIEGLWCAINKISGEIVASRPNRCDLLHSLVIMGYARI